MQKVVVRAVASLACALAVACVGERPEGAAKADSSVGAERGPAEGRAEREGLARALEREGIDDPAVLEAIRVVPRHEFVPASQRELAYTDRPLPIGHGQTISQPHVVALMTELAQIEPGDRVLEVGTGSGYQAAVLAELGAEVWSVEIVEPLAREAAANLARLGYDVRTRVGDGYRGWPEAAPFDAIVITAAPPEVPRPLLEQLAVGGRLVVPVGDAWGAQELVVITRTEDGFARERSIPVRFVPMTGEAQRQGR